MATFTDWFPNWRHWLDTAWQDMQSIGHSLERRAPGASGDTVIWRCLLASEIPVLADVRHVCQLVREPLRQRVELFHGCFTDDTPD
jgi:hypothetical protein